MIGAQIYRNTGAASLRTLNLLEAPVVNLSMAVETTKSARFEATAMKLYKRFGAFGLIALATLFSVVSSLVVGVPMTTFALRDSTLAELKDPISYIPITAMVPLIIAPIVTYGFTRLLKNLDDANKRIIHLSTTDPLTGSANRRGFMTAASQNIHTLRDADSCMVGMVDLDKFKLVNDTYGHQVGDQVLTCVAERLSEEIDELGIVGRLGGDEFAFVAFAPELTLRDLKNRINANCISLHTPDGIEFSCSIGMVSLIENESIDDALARADSLLYDIKASRRSGPESIVRRA